MALMQEVKRVAAEFDFTDDDVNRSVKEFIAEMSAYTTNNDRRNN